MPIVAVKWSLPRFSLQMIIGKEAAQTVDETKPLACVREVISGKRSREDPAAEELFTAKRHATTDSALAAEVSARRWEPSHELVSELVRRKCWQSATALLNLPELDEDLAIRLLAARPELLAEVVRHTYAPNMLGQALQNHFPASQMPGALEVLLEWLEAHHALEEKTRVVASGLPRVPEITTFMRALVDGCLPSLLRLEADLLERALESLVRTHSDCMRTQRLYTIIREVCRFKRKPEPVGTLPGIEVVRLDF